MHPAQGRPGDLPVVAIDLENARAGQMVRIRPPGGDAFTVVFDFPARNGRVAPEQVAAAEPADAERLLISRTFQLEHDPPAGLVYLGGKRLALRAQEYRLLCFLFRHPGQLLTRGQLLAGAWADALETDDRALESCISRLRCHRLGEAAVLIETCRGLGYRFNPEPRQD